MSEAHRSNLLSINQKGGNMFGCQPCPKCGSKYRYPMRRDAKQDTGLICCDDCGYREAWIEEDEA